MSGENLSFKQFIGIGAIIIIMIAIVGTGLLVGYPEYKVWKMDKAGQAQLAEAEWTKKIKTEEARANLESAKLDKEAMIIRAQGTAAANKIVSGSLDPLYINYLIAEGLVDSDTQVVYIPTEGSLPIIEAGRMNQPVVSNSEE